MFFFDPLYFMFIGPPMLLAMWATFKVKSAFNKAKKIRASSGMSGAEAAAHILQRSGLHHVRIEPTNGFLGDHYDPRNKVLRLSPDVYQGRSLAAVGVAAHEVGHAIQDQAEYSPLALRNAIVPMAGIGSNASFLIFILGSFMHLPFLMVAAIVLFSAVVIFQLINLPVEFNASARARVLLVDTGVIRPDEDREVGKVLNAAAMTYVASTLTAIATLVFFIVRSGLLGGRN